MPKRLVTQPSVAPVRKIKYAAIWGGLVAIGLPILAMAWPDAQECIDSAGIALDSFAPYVTAIFAGWMTRERDNPATSAT